MAWALIGFTGRVPFPGEAHLDDAAAPHAELCSWPDVPRCVLGQS